MNYPKVIVIAGPTASGKTSLGIDIALQFNGEIISADLRQVFKSLDIGSGKVTKEETKGVSHHLIDILEPEEKYNVYQFQKDCNRLIEEISSRNKLPIVVGGTGLYIESVVEQYKFVSAPSPLQGEGWGEGSKRRNLSLMPYVKQLRDSQTKEERMLWSKLKSSQLGFKFRRQYPIGSYILDFYSPKNKLAIEVDGGQHLENKEYDEQRTLFLNSLGIRVLRFWNNEVTSNLTVIIGTIMEELKKPSPNLSLQGRGIAPTKLGLRPNTLVLNLNPDREVIKSNIQKRLLERWNKQNMLFEVESLIESGVSKTWLKSLGLEYRFITEYLEGKFESEEEMLEKLNTASWQFAKRQITFLKRWSYAQEVRTQSEALMLAGKFINLTK